MYLSKITFDPSRVSEFGHHLGGGPYTEHQFIWQLFPDQPDHERDFLYRRESGAELPFYYLQSKRQPTTTMAGVHIFSKVFSPKLNLGESLRFSLRANAVKTTHDGSGGRRRIRRDIVEAALDQYRLEHPDTAPPSEEIRQNSAWVWLQKQGEKQGFQVQQLRVENHHYCSLNKPKSTRPIKFASMDYSGILKIERPETFTQTTLTSGLGRSKSFGCGLMLISRL